MGIIILWESADGEISVGYPMLGQEAVMIEKWEKTARGINATRLPDRDETDLPSREFRAAWRANPDGSIRVDDTEKQKIITQRAKLTVNKRLDALEKQSRG